MLVAAVPNASAQTADSPTRPGDLVVGYEALLAEYRAFRPLTPGDSTVQSARQVAEAVAAVVARRPTSADGVRRLEVDGLVVDQTITRFGREFYLEFYRLWVPPPEAVAFTVEIVEQPEFRTSTAVLVRVNDEQVFQDRLNPRSEDIEEDARRAVAAAYRRLQRRSAPPSFY